MINIKIMKKSAFTLSLLGLLSIPLFGQEMIWSENFESAGWDLNEELISHDASYANMWYISDGEAGGLGDGVCRESGNGNNTLYVGAGGTIGGQLGEGAVYNTGVGAAIMDVTTDKRSKMNSPISTVGKSNLSLKFNWIGGGDPNLDYASLEYSLDGTSWQELWTNPIGETCGDGVGKWKTETVTLTAALEEQAALYFAWRWRNDNEGEGDGAPSFAVDDMELWASSETPDPEPDPDPEPEPDPDPNSPLTAYFTIDTNIVCAGDCISFRDESLGEPTSWFWTFEGGNPATSTKQNPKKICFDEPGVYDITLLVSNGDEMDEIVTSITVLDLPEIVGWGDTIIDMNGTAILYANPIDDGELFWEPSETLNCSTCTEVEASPNITTIYYPSLLGTNGCIGRDTVIVSVNFEDVIDVASAFSPDGDGFNDVLNVLGVGITELDFRIYNRYGQLVFKTTDPEEGWDGTMEGKPVNQGVYVYTLKYTLVNGSEGKKSGNITLIK